MGQAKLRGDFEQRRREAIDRLTAELESMRKPCVWTRLAMEEYRSGCGFNRGWEDTYCPECGHPVEVGNE